MLNLPRIKNNNKLGNGKLILKCLVLTFLTVFNEMLSIGYLRAFNTVTSSSGKQVWCKLSVNVFN